MLSSFIFNFPSLGLEISMFALFNNIVNILYLMLFNTVPLQYMFNNPGYLGNGAAN
jgi:hypothetical protein